MNFFGEYDSQIQSLTFDDFARFYKTLAHNLTVTIRAIWSDSLLPDSSKIAQIKAVNEILHQVIARIPVQDHELHPRREDDMADFIRHWVSTEPAINGHVASAIRGSWNTVVRVPEQVAALDITTENSTTLTSGKPSNTSPIMTKEQFIDFLSSHISKCQQTDIQSTNDDLVSYLNALRGFACDMDGYYRNRGKKVDLARPGWRVFADLLEAARIYE